MSKKDCPTCGAECEIKGSDEGTQYYEPKKMKALKQKITELEEIIRQMENEDYFNRDLR